MHARSPRKTSDALLRKALLAAEFGVWDYDERRGGADIDARTADFFGLPVDTTFAALPAFMSAIHPDDAPRVEEAMAASGRFFVDFRTVADDGRDRWLRAAGWRETAHSGVSFSGVTYDITEEVRRKEELELLVGEMRHRVGNLFSILGGLIAIKAAEAQGVTDLAEDLRGQLSALSKAHALSLGDDPLGATLSLHNLASALAQPFAGAPDRFILEGPEIRVGEIARTSLSLMLYEWLTNALKYGSLSAPSGAVRLSWKLDEASRISMVWEETGGPEVVRPQREGFGGKLQRAALARIKGEAAFDWRQEGLVIRFSADADSLSA